MRRERGTEQAKDSNSGALKQLRPQGYYSYIAPVFMLFEGNLKFGTLIEHSLSINHSEF